MTRLPRVSGRAVVAALRRGGFHLSHVRGSHRYLVREDSKRVVPVPIHGNRTLPPGTLRSILNLAEMTTDDLIDLL